VFHLQIDHGLMVVQYPKSKYDSIPVDG